MRFSVIMPSLLADFPGAATNRPSKLLRAIQSVLNQEFDDYELIVIADGCALTEYLVKKNFTDKRIKLLKVDRKGLFGNGPRNAGIDAATGQYILYLDNDDAWGTEHLKIINENIKDEDWVYFADKVWNGKEWICRPIDVTQYGKCGTSNICHASRLNLRWKESEAGYGHDYMFIQQLRQFPNNRNIGPAEYCVCHIGNTYCL